MARYLALEKIKLDVNRIARDEETLFFSFSCRTLKIFLAKKRKLQQQMAEQHQRLEAAAGTSPRFTSQQSATKPRENCDTEHIKQYKRKPLLT